MHDKLPALILPGLGNSGPDHWQSQWERRDAGCQRVQQREWDTPRCEDWIANLDAVVAVQGGPVVLVAHSAACAMVAHWTAIAPTTQLQHVHGALLVSPADPEGPNFPQGTTGFGPMPTHCLPFPTIVVTGTDDPYVDAARARQFTDAWGGRFVLLQKAGHINVASGFGPWPEGFALLDSLSGLPTVG